MLRSMLLSAAALLLSVSNTAQACSCIEPPPLSQCAVGDNEAALLITIKCVKSLACTINDGVAVADVIIDRVFKDNTDLDLEEGDMATISSLLQSATCGIGASFVPGGQWIMFVVPTPEDTNSIDDFTSKRRLQQSRVASRKVKVSSRGRGSVDAFVSRSGDDSGDDGVFSDGSICDVMDADLQTNLCAGNILEPTLAEIEELAEGCANPIVITPPVLASKAASE